MTFQELLSDADDLGCIISITTFGVVFHLSMYGSLDHDGGTGPFLQSWDVLKLLLEMVELSLFAIPLDMPTFCFCCFFFGSFLDFYFQVSTYGLKCNHEREQEHVVICAIVRNLAQGRMDPRMGLKLDRRHSPWLRYRLTTTNEYAPRLFSGTSLG